ERDTDPSYDEDEAVTIELQGDTASCDSSSVTAEAGKVTISEGGTYIISGSLTDGQIIVDAEDDTVQLVLSGCGIECSTSAAVYVKAADKVFLTLDEGSSNELSNSGTFEADGDNNVDGVIFSKDDLTINGDGGLTISSSDHAVVCKDDLVIAGGQIDITASGDGIQSKETLTIEDGIIDIEATEAIESTQVTIDGGTLTLTASDDGINASQKSDELSPAIVINGGDITIIMGQGDTDAIDSNGSLTITGGTLDITAQFPFDYDSTCEYTGGTIYVNGEQTDTITNQFEDGMGFGGMGMPSDPGDMTFPSDMGDFEPPVGGGMEPPSDGSFPEPPQGGPGPMNN
ncbi:MAG: carbohydrate-binding domain-containing protein, partial [Clostridiales bacterium]|nr:carbohydrate-binding domain-containing protein [Clostridiales bacterium]